MKKNFVLLLAFVSVFVSSCSQKEYDLCIYGGTASGIVAADAAARMGLDVIVIEPTCRIGGMATGGLGRTDIGNKQVVRGLGLKFFRELGKHYGNLENWFFEPGAALEVMNEFADSPRITVRKEYRLQDVVVEDGVIKSISAVGPDTLKINAGWFIDCSYEGDLMAAAGVSYRIGREDNSEYNEKWNGSQLLDGHQFPDGVDPYVIPGKPESGLLWGISDWKLKEDGTGDDYIQAYNYRICLTDSLENMIPIGRPDNYDSTKYELLARLYQAQPERLKPDDYFIWTIMPGRKTDINNRGAFSTDMIGMNHSFPEADWKERDEIIKAHKDYTLGLLYFTATDPRVPEQIRNFVKNWGLPKDEYTECGNWTPQLYVRESRRMVGQYVATQADCENLTEVTDGIAAAAYQMDSHNCERIVVVKDGKAMVKNEGNVEKKAGYPYPISYRSITPKPEECTNLLVPVCCSASHIAYGSIRMEPVFMCMGQAAGIAVGLAERGGLKRIQDVDASEIKRIIDTDPYQDGTVPDIIVDDPAADTAGVWTRVESRKGFGRSWIQTLDPNACATFTATASVAGRYEIYSYLQKKKAVHSRYVRYEFPDGTESVVDAENVKVVGQTSGAWHKIGEVRLKKGESYSVKARGGEEGSILIADAIMLVKK